MHWNHVGRLAPVILAVMAIAPAACGHKDDSDRPSPSPSPVVAPLTLDRPVVVRVPVSPATDAEVRSLRAELRRVEAERDDALAQLHAVLARQRGPGSPNRRSLPSQAATPSPSQSDVFTDLSTSPQP